ncbi:MAG: co-chaperone GroES [Candidatus Uhrbacteria bacterium]|nr:co-chaperone GroES [Patescibacteria group bacterium]MBU1906531.1 co-chaperone GroES [Patescibacteria group bacterium]
MLKPLSDFIILKSLSREEVTASGIILPDTVDKERPESGEVLAVGPGRILEDGKRTSMEVKPGDKVMFKKYAPDEIKIDGEEYLVIRMDDVVGVIE